jgi:hypothetical protein
MLITRTDLIVLAFLSERAAHAWEIDRRLVRWGRLLGGYSRPISFIEAGAHRLVQLLRDQPNERRSPFGGQ